MAFVPFLLRNTLYLFTMPLGRVIPFLLIQNTKTHNGIKNGQRPWPALLPNAS